MERDIMLRLNEQDIWIEVSETTFRNPKVFLNLNDKIPTEYRYGSIFLHTIELYQYAKQNYELTEKPSVAGYAGKHGTRTLVFDFDTKDDNDISLTHNEVIGFIDSLQQLYELSDEQIRVYFSGKKGFHIILPISIFGHDYREFDFDIYKRCERVADILAPEKKFKRLDTDIYKITGLLRLPNTQREDSELHKIPLTVLELRNQTIDEIRELARTPRNEKALFDDSSFYESDPVPELVDLWWADTKGNKAPRTPSRTTSSGVQRGSSKTPPTAADFTSESGSAIIKSTPGWQSLLNKTYPDGTRTQALTSILGGLCAQEGADYKAVQKFIHMFNATHFTPPLSDEKIESTLNSIWNTEQRKIKNKKKEEQDKESFAKQKERQQKTKEEKEKAEANAAQVQAALKQTNIIQFRNQIFIPTPDNQPPQTMDCITFNDVSFAKPGYLSAIKGHLKIGKSNIASAIVAATVDTSHLIDEQRTLLNPELLGFAVNHRLLRRIIYLDCEQDAEDLWWSYHGVYRRLGISMKEARELELNFSGIEYNGTRGKTVEERKNYLRYMCEAGDLSAVIVDSGRGLMYDFNSVDDSMHLLEFLEGLAVKHRIAIIVTIHKNLGKPKDGSAAKSVGHFGSMLEQQAYCVLDIEKYKEESLIKIDVEPDNRRRLYVQYARRGGSGILTSTWFDFDIDRELFVECEAPTPDDEPSQSRKNDVEKFIMSIKDEATETKAPVSLNTTQLAKRLGAYLAIAEKTASNYISYRFKDNFSKYKTGHGVFEFTPWKDTTDTKEMDDLNVV